MTILLDTVIVIDYLRNLAPAVAFVERVRDGACLSVITRAEVLVGVAGKDRAAVGAFLDCFPLCAIDRAAADLAADLRRTHRWKLPDAFQAALADLHKAKLATRNTRDFPPEQYPFVMVPYIL